MVRSGITYVLLLISFSPALISAQGTFSQYENEYEIAYKEKEYAFRLVPEFYRVLSGKGYVPSLNFNSIRWRYRNEMRRHPENPFLAFCIGELYRYKNKYEEAFKYYDMAIKKAGKNVSKHTILLELFSQRRLLKWQMKEEEKFLELKKDFGALSLPLLSKYFFVRGREAAQGGFDTETEKNVRISKELNPYNLGIRHFYVRYLFLNRRFEFFDELLSLVHIIFLDFKTRLHVIIFSYNLLFTLLAIFLSTLVIAYFIKYFPSAVSKIITFTPRKLPISMRYFISVTFMLLPLIWTIPSLYTFIFMLIIPIPFLKRNERWVVQSFILLLCVVSLFGSFQTRAITAMDPTQKIEILDSMQKSRFESKWIRKCDSLLTISQRDYSIYFLKGLQLKRGGFFDEAEKNYRKAISITPNLYQTYNNLGNVLFWKGEIDSSIKYYELAKAHESKAPEPHYNLAQAYVRKLRFDKSFRHMKISSQLNFDLITTQIKNSKEVNNRFLIDLTLPKGILWKEFSSLEEDKSIFPWKYIGFDYRIFSSFLIGFFFIFIVVPRVTKSINTQCPICSSPISKGNSRIFQNETICWRCYRKLSSIHSVDIQERLRDKIRMDAQRRVRYTAIFWGLFLPGLGHLQIGKIKTGTFYLLIFSILCSMLFINRVTKITFYLPFPKGMNFGLYITSFLIILLYLFSLLNLFGSDYEER
ncbi:MAG: hypothetical protein E3J41_03395 [Candidatus Cloacimonadota bacterium]|nr:MAG: hypothetical protein E3J41_03395 [Candidatus Cloacimonadota bacterium]